MPTPYANTVCQHSCRCSRTHCVSHCAPTCRLAGVGRKSGTPDSKTGDQRVKPISSGTCPSGVFQVSPISSQARASSRCAPSCSADCQLQDQKKRASGPPSHQAKKLPHSRQHSSGSLPLTLSPTGHPSCPRPQSRTPRHPGLDAPFPPIRPQPCRRTAGRPASSHARLDYLAPGFASVSGPQTLPWTASSRHSHHFRRPQPAWMYMCMCHGCTYGIGVHTCICSVQCHHSLRV